MKYFIYTLLAAALGGVVYVGVFAIPVYGQSLLTDTTGTDKTGIKGVQVLSFLDQLYAIRFDNASFNAVFDDALFQSFTDFTVKIVDQNIGRPNPFLPAGRAPAATTPAAAAKKPTPATLKTPAATPDMTFIEDTSIQSFDNEGGGPGNEGPGGGLVQE
jgi:hypothetical protein